MPGGRERVHNVNTGAEIPNEAFITKIKLGMVHDKKTDVVNPTTQCMHCKISKYFLFAAKFEERTSTFILFWC